MRVAVASYRRTLIAASVAGVAAIAATCAAQPLASALLPAAIALVFFVLGSSVGVLLLVVALSVLLVASRHSRQERGEPDLFLTINRARSERALHGKSAMSRTIPFSSLRRLLGAPQFIVGDSVRICSLDKIALTIDANGCLDGLPFMPEMTKFCGTTGVVYRCVDKIYDYGGKKDLRRLRETVLVAGLRCDGSAHEGCQTACHILWKTAWLERGDAPATHGGERPAGQRVVAAGQSAIPIGRTFIEQSGASDRRYICQYTELVKASAVMSARDPRQDLRPFIAGNVTLAAFTVGLLTRLFNAVQSVRGGVNYPPMQATASTTSSRVDLDLQPGEVVRVASPEKILATLDRTGRNRGLWFDRELLKHCGQRYAVLRRVDRIIDDASGRMLRMKTPCIVLDSADGSGEYLRFCAQHDYAFWREAWLERVEDRRPPAANSLDASSSRALGPT